MNLHLVKGGKISKTKARALRRLKGLQTQVEKSLAGAGVQILFSDCREINVHIHKKD
jgi:Ser/Thr protein kinase RdoA (MazF antagonist)